MLVEQGNYINRKSLNLSPKIIDEINLSGKTVVVTGSTDGIGKEIALTSASHGGNIVICGRDLSKAEDVLFQIKNMGRNAIIVIGDVSKAQTTEEIKKRSKDEFGTIDILINNAGIAPNKPLAGIREKDWDLVINTNLKSVYMLTHAIAPLIRLNETGGSIVNISSMIAQIGNIGQTSYAASKGGVEAFTLSAAKEFEGRGVNITAAALGLVEGTGLTSGLTKQQIKSLLELTPDKKSVPIKEVAETVLFLASPQSKITGKIVNIF